MVTRGARAEHEPSATLTLADRRATEDRAVRPGVAVERSGAIGDQFGLVAVPPAGRAEAVGQLLVRRRPGIAAPTARPAAVGLDTVATVDRPVARVGLVVADLDAVGPPHGRGGLATLRAGVDQSVLRVDGPPRQAVLSSAVTPTNF